MKKVLSLVLALALVLTTIVVPMTVSAANGDVTIEYAISAVDKDSTPRADGTIYVGDTVTVRVLAKGTARMEGYEIYIPYSGIEINENITYVENEHKFIKFLSEADATATSAGLEIGSFSFTAPAAGNYSINAVSSDSFFGDGWALSTFTSASQAYAVLAHTAAVNVTGGDVNVNLVENSSTSASTETATDLTVAITSASNSAITDVTLNDASFNPTTEKISGYGEYTIKFKTQDGVEHTYTFIYKTSTQIDVLASINNASGFKPGDTVTLNIKVSELSDSVVEGLTFGIKYATDAFTIGEAPANVQIKDGTGGAQKDISWFVPEGKTGVSGTGEQNAFALTFTVSDTYKVVGTKTFELVNEKAAINGFDADEEAVATVGINDKAYATIHNGAETFAVTAPSSEWAKTKTGSVAYAEGWSGTAVVKYKAFDEAQADAATIFASATEVPLPAEITVNTAQNYYIVARFGDEGSYVYQLVATWSKTDVKIDNEAPTASVDPISDWANYTTRPTITINVADNDTVNTLGSGVASVKYNFTSADAEDSSWKDASYTPGAESATVGLPDEAVVYATIYVKVADALNNVSTAKSFEIKYDNKAPVIKGLVEGTFDGEGVTITGTLTDEGNASAAPTVVEVWKDGVQQANAALAEGAISFKATSNGTYTFKATDGAGNTGTADIDVTKAQSQSTLVEPEFQVVKGEGAPKGKFKGAGELSELGLATNGTFTYVKMIPGTVAENSKLTTTYTLQKDSEEAATVPAVELDAANESDKGVYTLVVKTIYDGNESDYKTETYKFTIAGAYDTAFSTVDGDIRYTVMDYRIMDLLRGVAADDGFKAAVTLNTADEDPENDRMLWTGGYFAGDVDGSLEAADWAADAATLLAELKTAKSWKQYKFDLFNNKVQQ